MAKTMASLAMEATISLVTQPGPETPRKTSAPCMASARQPCRPRGFVRWGYLFLRGIEAGRTGIQYPLPVAQRDMFQSQRHEQLGAGDPCGSGAVDHGGNLSHFLSHQLQRIDQRCAYDNGRAVLIVVEYGDIQFLPQPPLNFKAPGGRRYPPD